MRFRTLTLGCKVNQFETQAMESILASRGHLKAGAGEMCDVCIINTCAVTAESVRKSRQAVRRMRRLEPDALIAVCGCYSQIEPPAVEQLGADLTGGSGDRQGFVRELEKLFEGADSAAGIDGTSPESGIRAVGAAPRSPMPASDEPAGNRPVERCDPVFEIRYAGSITESKSAERCDQETGVRAVGAAPRSPMPASDEPAGKARFEELPPGGASGRTRALLKIQDGCDNFCAYCIVPYARGRARSLQPQRAADHARWLEAQGFREIVITGIEISSYGKDLEGSPLLTDVVREIGAAAPGARLRLGSLDPGVVTESFCEKLRPVKNLCGHFHLSLQSGCDETLRRMGRKYDTDTVSGAITMLRKHFTDCGITADLITGFPGETVTEFERTLAFIKSAGFSGMHIFPFSPRPGTQAAAMQGQISRDVRRERAHIAAAVAGEMATGFRLSQIGKIAAVLFERRREGFWTGHSGNYIEVTVREGGARNRVDPVRITSVSDGTVWGEILR